ncbi:MAG: caspase family protein [Pirellulales bacterium]
MGLWIPETGKQLYLFKAHTSGVRSVVFDPTGKKFVTGSQGGGVVVWDADRRAKLQEFKGHTGAVNCITFSRDGRLVATASADDTAILWEAATGRPLYTLSGHTADINSVAISPDSKRVLTASSDGTTRLWDTTTGKELVQLINFNKGQSWVAVTREGYFDGTLDGQRLITWRIGEQVFPLELYEKQFHRPDLVSRVLRGLPIDGQATVPADRTPPQVTVEVESQEGAETVVKVTARPGGPKASIADIRVLVGGRDLGPERKRNIVREQATGPVAVFRATVDVPPGRKEAAVAAVATDDLGLQSEPAFITVRRAGEIDPASRKLYVLAVGVSKYKFPEYELLFADKDATALAANLSKQKGKAFGDVEVRVIVNEEATAENVKAGLDWLKASCKPQDVAVVLFSGHGIRGQGGLYYVTHDGDLDDLKQTCVSWRDLSDRLKEVRAWQIVFLADCCHAGSFGERGATQDELAADLVKEAGVMVFASSRGREKSIESTEWGHGAFTRALLDGLEGKADALPRDGQVTISELQAFVTDHVGKQTDDRQHPHIPRLENFDPGLVIGQVR